MKVPSEGFRLPEDKQQLMKRAKHLAWITIAFMVSIIGVIGFTMGSSEAMKAVWIEDVLSLIPPVAFLIGTRYLIDRPTHSFRTATGAQ